MNFKIGLKSLVTNHGDLRAVSAGATSLLCFLRKRSAIPISGYPAGWRSPTVAIHHAANERAVANSHGMPLFSLGSSGNSQGMPPAGLTGGYFHCDVYLARRCVGVRCGH
jgi:hypothetical protein